MRRIVVVVGLFAVLASPRAFAQTATDPTASGVPMAPPSAAAASAAHYTVADTDIGTLLDDPAARAVLDKHIPGFSKGGRVNMARSRTLRSLKPFAPDTITDQVLADIDADLAALPVKN
jgi:para-nitrobenzyl esterase